MAEGHFEPSRAPGVPGVGHAAAPFHGVGDVPAPLRGVVIAASLAADLEGPLRRRTENEAPSILEGSRGLVEESLGIEVALGFAVETAVLQVHPQNEGDLAAEGEGVSGGWQEIGPQQVEGHRVPVRQKIGAEVDFGHPPIASVGQEYPAGGGAGVEAVQVRVVQGCDEAVGVHPGPQALGQDVAVAGVLRVEIGPQQAIVF